MTQPRSGLPYHEPYVINPVLVIPGADAPEDDVLGMRAAIPALQAWFQAQGVYLMVLDPKAPIVDRPWSWFAEYPGGPFYAAQELAVTEGWRSADAGRSIQTVVFLEGYPAGHGESGPSVAVVSYAAVDAIREGQFHTGNAWEEGRSALGLWAHEIGHLLGLGHTQAERDLMHAAGWWPAFPYVGLSARPQRTIGGGVDPGAPAPEGEDGDG